MEHTPEVGEPFSWEPAAFTEEARETCLDKNGEARG